MLGPKGSQEPQMTSPAPPHGWSPEMAASQGTLWSPPYIGVKCGPLPQRNLLQLWAKTILGKRHFFFIPSLPDLTQALHFRLPFDLLRCFGCSQLWALRPSLIAPSPLSGRPLRDHPQSFASRCEATPTMVSNWPLGNTLPAGRLHEVGELKFGSGAVMGAY